MYRSRNRDGVGLLLPLLGGRFSLCCSCSIKVPRASAMQVSF